MEKVRLAVQIGQSVNLYNNYFKEMRIHLAKGCQKER